MHEAPRALLNAAAEYAPSLEEELCCGFGGTYSAKFPESSAQLPGKKLSHVKAGGATCLASDCPGRVMQFQGGAAKKSLDIKVMHLAEVLAENLKKQN